MNQQLKTAGILAGVLLALGGLATWDEWQTKKDEKKKETENRLLALEPDKVTGIEFSNREGSTPVEISMERVSGKWQITRPLSASADQPAVDNLLATLRDYKFESVVAENSSTNPGAFGLDKPRRILSLTTDKGTIKITVGANTPVGYSVYSTADGPGVDGPGRVHVGSQHLAVSTGKTLHDLRDKRLLSFGSSQVTAFELIRPGKPTLKVEKRDGSFSITAPQALAAEQGQVSSFLDGIITTNATEFFDKPDKKLAGAFKGKTLAEVRMTLEDKSQVTVKLIEKDKKLYVWTGDAKPIAHVPDDTKGKVEKSMDDFRDRKIFSFTGDLVTEVVLDGKVFKKKDGEWFGEDEPTKAVSQIRSLIVDLEFAKASEILDAKDKAVKDSTDKAPAHSVRLAMGQAIQPLDIQVWEKQGATDSFLIKHSGPKGTNSAYVIGKASLSAIESMKAPAKSEVDLGHD